MVDHYKDDRHDEVDRQVHLYKLSFAPELALPSELIIKNALLNFVGILRQQRFDRMKLSVIVDEEGTHNHTIQESYWV